MNTYMWHLKMQQITTMSPTPTPTATPTATKIAATGTSAVTAVLFSTDWSVKKKMNG